MDIPRNTLLEQLRYEVGSWLQDVQISLRTLARMSNVSYMKLWRFLADRETIYPTKDTAFYDALLSLDNERRRFWPPSIRKILVQLRDYYRG